MWRTSYSRPLHVAMGTRGDERTLSDLYEYIETPWQDDARPKKSARSPAVMTAVQRHEWENQRRNQESMSRQAAEAAQGSTGSFVEEEEESGKEVKRKEDQVSRPRDLRGRNFQETALAQLQGGQLPNGRFTRRVRTARRERPVQAVMVDEFVDRKVEPSQAAERKSTEYKMRQSRQAQKKFKERKARQTRKRSAVHGLTSNLDSQEPLTKVPRRSGDLSVKYTISQDRSDDNEQSLLLCALTMDRSEMFERARALRAGRTG